MKYLYPYECEKEALSTVAELQSAIDGNRRETRRPIEEFAPFPHFAHFPHMPGIFSNRLGLEPIRQQIGAAGTLLRPPFPSPVFYPQFNHSTLATANSNALAALEVMRTKADQSKATVSQ